MARIFGFDIGTTSIGFSVVEHDRGTQSGSILRLGVRVFPEARDPEGTPLNQQRRQRRMARRQLRRRRQRRRLLNEILNQAGLLPAYGSTGPRGWDAVMNADPYALRKRGLTERLEPYELGRALYHLSKRRHFRGRDLVEDEGEVSQTEAAEEKEAASNREATLAALHAAGTTLGAWLADKKADAGKRNPPRERRRGYHANRKAVEQEFEVFWRAQQDHHPVLKDAGFKRQLHAAIFSQRPVFWRKNTLGECRFMPGEPLCPKGSWVSQQRRMLEKLTNLALVGGNARPLTTEERAAVLKHLQTQASMTWGKVRSTLKPFFEDGAEKRLRFNLEFGGEPKLLGNPLEAKLAKIFGPSWTDHPHKQAIREAVHERLWHADYGEIGTQRVVILDAAERKRRRAEAVRGFVGDFGITSEQAAALEGLTFPTGWEPFSTKALEEFLPELEAGERFGALINGPEWEDWRDRTFPHRERPTGEVFDRLPSPAVKEERNRIAKLRNPTVVRAQNELRKVVNNLIALYGKPDLIRVEVARDVGRSKRDREEVLRANRQQERRRKDAIKDLEANQIFEPSRDTVEKWLLWKECRERCPYSGDQIGFDALFREGRYDVEHIWPRSKSFDNSYKNKTLCHRDKNIEKGDLTPFEAFGNTPEWERMTERVWDCVKARTMSRGKAKRFCDPRPLPDDFVERQLNDTGYAARQAVAFLQRLWPDVGPTAPVHVQAVTGRVTAQLRRLWGLNNVLSDDGEKTRADHRHHAIDALTVACTHPGMTNRLSRYWQAKDDLRAERPDLTPPWPTIRADAEQAVADIVVSHRVRKKISGPLHKETTYGDTQQTTVTKVGTYRYFVTRKRVETLGRGELGDIRDARVRRILNEWVESRGGDPKKAFPPYPRLSSNGPEIRKVRLLIKRQPDVVAPVSTGYADLGSNHHIAIYRRPNGKADFEVVSLLEAARRVCRYEPLVRRDRGDGAQFVMSLAPGDMVRFAKSPGERRRIWRVQKIATKGQISLLDHTDCSRDEWSLFEPMVGGLISRKAEKISVDPVGRIRRAND